MNDSVHKTIDFIAKHPGSTSREVTEAIFEDGEFRSSERTTMGRMLAFLTDLGILRREQGETNGRHAPAFRWYVVDDPLAPGSVETHPRRNPGVIRTRIRFILDELSAGRRSRQDAEDDLVEHVLYAYRHQDDPPPGPCPFCGAAWGECVHAASDKP